MSTVSGISFVNNQYQTDTQNTFKQDFQALSNALQSGNLSAAQQAFSTLQTDMQGNQSNGTQQQSQNSTLSTDFNNLASTLQSGNLASAQQAFATLQQDMQQVQGQKSHHHHHHHQTDSTTAKTYLD